jgi:hypothetical protein
MMPRLSNLVRIRLDGDEAGAVTKLFMKDLGAEKVGACAAGLVLRIQAKGTCFAREMRGVMGSVAMEKTRGEKDDGAAAWSKD